MSDLSVSGEDMRHEVDRDALLQSWDALIAGKDEQAVQIYQDGAVLRLPQSGEKISGRANIAAHGLREPGERVVKVNRIIGDGGLWVSECETLRRRQMTLLVSIAEMQDGKIIREARYRVPKHISSRAAAG